MGHQPEIPPEIWAHIFRFATADPSSSLERFQLGASDGESQVWRESRGYGEALVSEGFRWILRV
jgi:hypothetical protein